MKNEENEHSALIDWCRIHESAHPELAGVFHVPNEGKRAPWKIQRYGIKAGVPDIMLPVPSADGQYSGLAIELKYGRNKPTENQRWWLNFLSETCQWKAIVHTSKSPGQWTGAARVIADYLDLPEDVRRWL